MMRLAGLVSTFLLLAGCSARGGEPGAPDAALLLADAPAPYLADYGFFRDAAADTPATGVVPYDLINPLFSDHAIKHRFVYVPKGKSADYSEDSVIDFPVGSALIKTFAFAPDLRAPGVREYKVETRVLIHKTDGWAAFPYIWNAEGTEAVYAPAGGRQAISVVGPLGAPLAIDYAIPNKNQCKTCHQDGDAVRAGRRAGGACHFRYQPAGSSPGAGLSRHQLCPLPQGGGVCVEFRSLARDRGDVARQARSRQASDSGGARVGRHHLCDRSRRSGPLDPGPPDEVLRGGGRHAGTRAQRDR